jgi:hypothetical protein
MPDPQVSPVAQSPSMVHVHCMPEWVAAHVAVGPHWLFEVQVTQACPTQTSPALHCVFETQVGHPPVHSTHTW